MLMKLKKTVCCVIRRSNFNYEKNKKSKLKKTSFLEKVLTHNEMMNVV